MNSKSFTPEDVEKGLETDLIKYLLDYNNKSESDYYDIHITSDGYCQTIEWEDVPYDHSYGGTFQYVDEDQCVMTECMLPDNSIVMCYNKYEVEEKISEFLKENPEYYQDENGRWVNRLEEEELRKEIEKHLNK